MARRAHGVLGGQAIAGRLLRTHILGERVGVEVEGAAHVMCSDSASIRCGTCTVRTRLGSMGHGRTRCDHFAYVPFSTRSGHSACVLEIEQILLIRKEGMGWPDDEARLAVGILYAGLPTRSGAGLESSYNDDVTRGSCMVPRALYCSHRRQQQGYKWAVHLHQIHCPCSVHTGNDGVTFLTCSKMSFHGRKDLQYVDG